MNRKEQPRDVAVHGRRRKWQLLLTLPRKGYTRLETAHLCIFSPRWARWQAMSRMVPRDNWDLVLCRNTEYYR